MPLPPPASPSRSRPSVASLLACPRVRFVPREAESHDNGNGYGQALAKGLGI
jgi:hypothetical protein